MAAGPAARPGGGVRADTAHLRGQGRRGRLQRFVEFKKYKDMHKPPVKGLQCVLGLQSICLRTVCMLTKLESFSDVILVFLQAGTTATVVLQTGWLVTCANVGDSLGFVDHGNEVGSAPRAGGCIGACRSTCMCWRAWS